MCHCCCSCCYYTYWLRCRLCNKLKYEQFLNTYQFTWNPIVKRLVLLAIGVTFWLPVPTLFGYLLPLVLGGWLLDWLADGSDWFGWEWDWLENVFTMTPSMSSIHRCPHIQVHVHVYVRIAVHWAINAYSHVVLIAFAV